MLYNKKNPHGGDVYSEQITLDFSSNTNPLGTPPGVVAAIRAAAAQVRQYPDPYCRALVSAIAAYEHVPARAVLCGAGAAELIYAYCQALRPVCAAELAPTFLEYSAAASYYGARVVRYTLSAEREFLPDEGLLAFLAEQKPEVLFLCSPNNPTGRCFPRPLLEKVLTCCRKQGTRVLLDECFLDFTEQRSAAGLLPDYPNVLLLKAFTKNYALAGVRVGYCLTWDTALLEKMAAGMQPWNVSLLAQQAGVAALQQTQFLQETRAMLPAKRAFMQQGLQALGFSVYPSEANYLLFRAPIGLDAALRREGIAIRNCSNYPGLGPGWYRTAVRLREENEALLAALRRVMEDETWR